MKKGFCSFDNYDFSDCHEITGNELYTINGGKQVENSNEGVANAQPGDTIIRDDHTEITLNQGDIDWAQAHMESGNSSTQITPDPINTIAAVESTFPTSDTLSSYTCRNAMQDLAAHQGEQNWFMDNNVLGYQNKKLSSEKNNWVYNPDEVDTDKRYNAIDYKGEHLMTINYKNKINFDDFAYFYTYVGQYGTAGTVTYDGIGITNDKGDIIEVLRSESSVLKYAESLNPTYEYKLYSPYHGKNQNTEYIINNQLKSERGVFFEKETSRFGSIYEMGFAKASSKLIKNGITGSGSFQLCNMGSAWKETTDHTKIGFDITLISVNGEFGFQHFGKRVTVGGGFGIGLSLGYESIGKSKHFDIGLLKGLGITVENNE